MKKIVRNEVIIFSISIIFRFKGRKMLHWHLVCSDTANTITLGYGWRIFNS